jgi:tRNA-modifying protein YgfZ
VSARVAPLPDRGVVRVFGPDARRLLHDLLTADVAALAPGQARLAALLSPQGKILFDFLIACEAADAFLVDIAGETAQGFSKRLLLYRLRARMEVAESAETRVAAVWGGAPEGVPGLAFPDPRLPDLGTRVVAPSLDLEAWLADRTAEPAESYHAHRVALGIAEGGQDYPLGDTFPHEACLDQLGGVDFGKGCYVGQEVVSRMEHRGTARNRVVPIGYDAFAPEAGVPVMAGERQVGIMGSSAAGRGLALLRLDRVADALAADVALIAGGVTIRPVKPDWARFPWPGETKAAE